MKKTLIIGASINPERYSYKAAHRLLEAGHEIVALGNKKGILAGQEILVEKPVLCNIHTVTLYIGQQKQKEIYDYVLSLKPKRILFNPGTKNSEFENIARKNGIEVSENCTLVLLSLNLY